MKKALALALAVVVLAAGLGFAPVVGAQGPAVGAEGGNVLGMGRLTASGDGIAVLGGRGMVDVSGNGILWVRDLAGGANIEVSGYGEKEVFPDGWIQYSGFNGEAHIAGGRIVVVIAGVDIELFAAGRGRVMLWGHGTYELNGQTGVWNAARGAPLRLGPPTAP